MTPRALLITATFFLAFIPAARADFTAGLKAYDRGDFSTALKEWKDAAEKGDLAAQRNLGHLYRWGHGVERNPSRAAYWYHRAARVGFDRAQYNLALMYLNGLGVPKDRIEALRWLKRSAKQGNTEAEQKLEELEAGKTMSFDSREAEGISRRTTSTEKSSASERPALSKSKPKAPEASDTPEPPVKETNTESLMAHIGSYRKEENIKLAWREVRKKYGDPGAFKQHVKKETVKGKGTFYRVYATGPEKKLRRLCAVLKRDGYCRLTRNGKSVD